jgi:DNA-binding beta-propeller fold protein YncE
MAYRSFLSRIGLSLICRTIAFCSFLMILGSPALAGDLVLPTVADPAYRIQALMPKTPANGFNGVAFDNQDNLYAGVVHSSTTYRIDKDTGAVSVFIPPPEGMADDLLFLPDNRVVWNAFFLGKVFVMGADKKIVTLAEGLPGINAIARSKEGRVFVSQCFLGDALWELDLSGGKKNRKIAEGIGFLNAFAVHSDGYIYGPLEKKGQVVRVDVNTGAVQVIAEGFRVPRAAKFDSKGNFYVLDTATGEMIQVDIKTGAKKLVAMIRPHLDNLAFDKDDRIFASTNGDSSIFEVDVKTGKVRTVVEGRLACPQGIAVWNGPEGEILFVADNFSYKRIDGFTGEVKENAKGGAFPNSANIKGDKVLMAGWFRNVVEVFDAKNDDLLYGVPGFKGALGMLMLDDGSILVAESGTNSIVRARDREGKQKDVVAKDLAHPVYMAPAGPDAVYVTEFLGDRVTRIDLNTGEKKTVANGVKGPKGIAVKPDGKIVVVAVGSRELLQIDPATGTTKPLVRNLAVGLFAAGNNPDHTLTGVAVAESGNIYVTSDIDNVVYKISPKK